MRAARGGSSALDERPRPPCPVAHLPGTVRALMAAFTRRHPDALLYIVAGVTYIAAGIWQKALLNWIVGPLWLVAFVELVPRLGRVLRPRTGQPLAEDGPP